MATLMADGKRDLLDILAAQCNADVWKVRLFKNNLTFDKDTPAASFTEATFNGYAPVTLTLTRTSDPVYDYVLACEVVFTKTTGSTSNTIYGWYVQNESTGAILWAEQITQVEMENVGATIDLTGALLNNLSL